mmetsp:Transcript_87243/g.241997  ORF Transcript_87243/g.241997 Transcript_87243/m.241997 type:complete len:121 (-) Transcript_87243:1138-1500(-)
MLDGPWLSDATNSSPPTHWAAMSHWQSCECYAAAGAVVLCCQAGGTYEIRPGATAVGGPYDAGREETAGKAPTRGAGGTYDVEREMPSCPGATKELDIDAAAGGAYDPDPPPTNVAGATY